MGFSALGVLMNLISQQYDLTFYKFDLTRSKRNLTNVAIARSQLATERSMQGIRAGMTAGDVNPGDQQRNEAQDQQTQFALSLIEKQIDQEMQDVDARIKSITSQMEDIRRVVKENIEFTHKNAYA